MPASAGTGRGGASGKAFWEGEGKRGSKQTEEPPSNECHRLTSPLLVSYKETLGHVETPACT